MLSPIATKPWDLLLLHPDGILHKLVGSVWALGEGNDTDIIWLVKDKSQAIAYLETHSFQNEAEEYEDTTFISMRRNNLNVLITSDATYYRQFGLAADVCKYLRIADKDNRIMVHNILVGKAGYIGDTLL